MNNGSRRVAWPRDEGIWRKLSPREAGYTFQVRCTICDRTISAAVPAKASHAKRHVREGTAVARTEYGHDGPRTVYEPSTPIE